MNCIISKVFVFFVALPFLMLSCATPYSTAKVGEIDATVKDILSISEQHISKQRLPEKQYLLDRAAVLKNAAANFDSDKARLCGVEKERLSFEIEDFQEKANIFARSAFIEEHVNLWQEQKTSIEKEMPLFLSKLPGLDSEKRAAVETNINQLEAQKKNVVEALRKLELTTKTSWLSQRQSIDLAFENLKNTWLGIKLRFEL